MADTTDAEVFIIESLRFSDEKHRREGEILSRMLQMAEKPPEYWYIRTKAELGRILQRFGKSRKRYLHISCHGSSKSLFTTLEEVSFAEFGQLAGPHLKGRRLFISACEATNKKLAATVIPVSGCFSVIGPVGEIEFGDAAIVWSAFYHLMFKLDDRAMRRRNLETVLTKVCKAFGVAMKYYREDGNKVRGSVFRPPKAGTD